MTVSLDFTPSPEQQALRDSVRRYCAQHCAVDASRTPGESTSVHWRAFARLGWLGAALPEDVGGAGGSATENAIIFEELGRALVREPFLSCVALSGQLIDTCGPDEQRVRLLTPLVRGEMLVSFAHADGAPGTLARRCGDGYSLTGYKRVVLGAPGAALMLTPARIVAGSTVDEYPSVFVVDMSARGVTKDSYVMLDGTLAADIALEDVRADTTLGAAGSGSAAIEHALDHALVMMCADMVGAMEGLLWSTRDYLRMRRQYGVPLSSFQVVQHRLAEMFAEMELSRSIMYQGLSALGQPAAARHKRVAATKAFVSRSAGLMGHWAIQLHGAMGVAESAKVTHYFRRLLTLAVLLGGAQDHLQRFAEPAAQPVREASRPVSMRRGELA
jgi:alkylation response protein AidB-like acyl-CoA dehydrogenase